MTSILTRGMASKCHYWDAAELSDKLVVLDVVQDLVCKTRLCSLISLYCYNVDLSPALHKPVQRNILREHFGARPKNIVTGGKSGTLPAHYRLNRFYS